MRRFLTTGLIAAAAFATPAFAMPDPGTTIPEITPVKVWNDKGVSKLSDFRGDYVLLDIWATW